MAHITLEVPKDGEKKSEFILANFTNGKLVNPENVEFGYFQSKVPSLKGTYRKRLVAETERLQYVGQNWGVGAPKAPSLAKYYVGVLDKKTNKMKVYNTQMFNMQPVLNEDKAKSGEDEVDKGLSYTEKVDMLTSAFGSTKKKRAMESRKRNAIKGDALDAAVGAAVDQALQSPAAQQLASPVKKQEAAGVIPPYNKDAATPEDAYLLKDIISPAEMEALQGPAQEFIDLPREKLQEMKESQGCAAYVLYHLGVLPIQPQARSHKARCLTYLQYMITLYGLRAQDLRNKDIIPGDVPDIVKKTLLDRFTMVAASGGNRKPIRCMPARLKDKLASYILTLCLIIDEFNLEFSQLQKDLKMGQQKIITHLRALGCKISTQKVQMSFDGPKTDVKTATLPVPLVFPELKTRAKKEFR